MSKHKKHTNLIRRSNENYAFQEITILGSKCSNIANLVQKITKINEKSSKTAYLDASHKAEIEHLDVDTFTFHDSGNLQVNKHQKLNPYTSKIQFSQYDLLLINGNHYQGQKQILILDKEKEASVLKRLDQLTNIQFVIKMKDDAPYFEGLVKRFPDIKNVACYSFNDIDNIAKHISRILNHKIPKVNGLVLVGGKSTRMGTDKSMLDYHGMPQKEYVKTLLENQGLQTYFSVEKSGNQENEIHDTFLNLGPFGGICSAFQKDPNKAWLVIATDLPFVDNKLIKHLVDNRDSSKVATAIKAKGKNFMEPLIAIYEPKAYPILLQYLAQGYSCPRKMLINNDVKIIEVDDDLVRNINTKEDYQKAKTILNAKTIHILNGDSTLERFPKKEIEGEYIVFREVLCEGPISQHLASDAFWTDRYDYFENNFDCPRLTFYDKTIKPIVQLEGLDNIKEITLWFENDLFCQVNMLAICTYLLESYRKSVLFYLVCTPKSLSHYSNEELVKFYESKIKLTKNDLMFAKQAWKVYSQKSEKAIKAFDFRKNRKFRFLDKIMEQELLRFSAKNKLNQIDQKIVDLVAQEITAKNSLIKELLIWQNNETLYGFGDLQYQIAIENLITLKIIDNIK